MKYEIAYLSGRCSNGVNGSKGTLYHAVRGDKALCGRTYGSRSAGWYYEGDRVTCEKCNKKLLKESKQASNTRRCKKINELKEAK